MRVVRAALPRAFLNLLCMGYFSVSFSVRNLWGPCSCTKLQEYIPLNKGELLPVFLAQGSCTQLLHAIALNILK